MPAIADRLKALNLTLPPAPKPIASYVPFVRSGSLVWISGQLPSRGGKVEYLGPVSDDAAAEMPIPRAQEAARVATLNALGVLQEACGGSLDAVVRIVRIGVFVQSPNGFSQQSAVANGASDLLVEIFGDAGKHARAAVGVNALPLNATVEVELLAEVR